MRPDVRNTQLQWDGTDLIHSVRQINCYFILSLNSRGKEVKGTWILYKQKRGQLKWHKTEYFSTLLNSYESFFIRIGKQTAADNWDKTVGSTSILNESSPFSCNLLPLPVCPLLENSMPFGAMESTVNLRNYLSTDLNFITIFLSFPRGCFFFLFKKRNSEQRLGYSF